MPLPTAEHLLAARPCGAAVAALFSSGSEPAPPARRPAGRPGRPLPIMAVGTLSRLKSALSRLVPCEDITFADQPFRRSRAI